MFNDSVDKIVRQYFSAITAVPFVYKGVDYIPKPVRVSPGITRGFTCPAGCGGCCPRFSLDYLPSETIRPPEATPREIPFNGRSITLWSDCQDDHRDHFCRNLDRATGRCNIHRYNPFSCDFELMRIKLSPDRADFNQQMFGRGWAFLRVDGQRGNLCEVTPPTEESWLDNLRKLRRLLEWATHFQLDTKLPDIIQHVSDSGPILEPRVF